MIVVEKTQDLFTLHPSLTQEGLILLQLYIHIDFKHTKLYEILYIISIHLSMFTAKKQKKKKKKKEEERISKETL